VKSISARARAAIGAQETGDEPLVALTITHADLVEPIRIVDFPEDVEKGGETFATWPFRVTLPGESKDELPAVSLEIDAVDRTITDQLLALTGEAPAVEFEVVLAATPDTTEWGPFHFQMRAPQIDVGLITAELGLPPVLDEPCPGGRMTPATHPALHAA
jgi:hypothetical protein